MTGCWTVLLLAAAFVLPPLDSHVKPYPVLEGVFLAVTGLLLLATAHSVVAYFWDAWQRLRTAPNKLAFAVWLGFETSVAVAAVVVLISGVMC